MSKQTAVEWLVEQLEFDVLVPNDDIKTVVEQALAMEREQHSETYNQGLASNFQKFEHYYEQTYGKEASHEEHS